MPLAAVCGTPPNDPHIEECYIHCTSCWFDDLCPKQQKQKLEAGNDFIFVLVTCFAMEQRCLFGSLEG